MHKIYRIDEQGHWNTYTKVIFPDGQIMDEDTHDFARDGFFWSEEPPQEYLDWLETQQNHINP